jgi:hypothetical protein
MLAMTLNSLRVQPDTFTGRKSLLAAVARR